MAVQPDTQQTELFEEIAALARERLGGGDLDPALSFIALYYAGASPEDWIEEVAAWRRMGASHLSVENRRAGLRTADDHIEMMRRFRDAVEF